jgi:hypothetical protein
MVLAMVMSVVMACTKATAVPTTLWQIGKFDQSSAEFNQGGAGRASSGGTLPQTPVVYIVGKSDPKRDWRAYQPGSANARAGHRPHPYSIQFYLPSELQGRYFLKVGFVAGRRRHESNLQLAINGQQGWVYHHPHWHDVPGDKYWSDEATVEIPAPALKSGANTLVLTAIDEPDQTILRIPGWLMTPSRWTRTQRRLLIPPRSMSRLSQRFSTNKRAANWWSWWMSTCATMLPLWTGGSS